MKKLLSLLLTIVFCFQVTSFSLAKTVDYEEIIPNYEEMLNDRLLIGTAFTGEDIYEFDKANPVFDLSGCFRLMDPWEVEEELKSRKIQYSSVRIVTVLAHNFLVIKLIDDSNYGLDLFYTSDDTCYVTMDSFRVFCINYFGNGYDFYDD